MSQPIVRELTHEHLPAFAWSGSPTHLRYVADAIDRAKAQEVDLLGIWIGRQAVALGGADYTQPGVVKMWMFTVHPDHRSQGLGTLLMGALEQRAKERGCHEATLSVEVANLRARALYERLGYLVSGSVEETWQQETEEGEVFTYHADCLVMRKALHS